MPIAIFLVCFAISVFAQDEELEKKSKGKYSPGFRVGLNLSNIQASSYYNSETNMDSYGSYLTLGVQLGMIFDWTMRWDKGHFQLGLMYIQKGAENKNSDVTKLHYLEIPLLFSLKFSAFRINVGPYHGILLNSELLNAPNSGYFLSYFLNDIGLSLGLGYDIGTLYIGVFFDTSFFPLATKDGSFYFYNNTFGLNLGVNL